jgi:hypothetical protein
VSVRKDQAAEQIAAVAGAVREVADLLLGRETAASAYADRAIDGLQRFADHLRESEPGDLLADLDALARRQPGIFIGGAFLLGIGVGRFLKSSAERGAGHVAHPRPEPPPAAATANASDLFAGQPESRGMAGTTGPG